MQYTSVRLAFQVRLLPVAMLLALLLGTGFLSQPAQAQTYNVLYTFAGGSQGYGPSDIIVAPDGTIYGAAAYGSGCACDFIFSFANNKLTVLHRWSYPSGHNAAVPQGLLFDKNSNELYGSTQFGGPSNNNCFADAGNACGNVFSYDLSAKKYKALHNFTGTPDGMDPSGIQARTSSYLYGVTWGGGADGWGSFYRVSYTGQEEILYSFKNSPDGQGPGWGLVPYQGKYYGVTIGGGINSCPDGCGTIFEVNSSGTENVLYSFTGGADGQNPYVLVGDSKGNFYGLSRDSNNVVVAVFEITSTGQFSIAYNGSFARLIQSIIPGPDGTLYGTASAGDYTCLPNGCGQIFQLTPSGGGNGTITILKQFHQTDGALPQFGSLVLHNGTLYGSTASGGSTNMGVIFSLKP